MHVATPGKDQLSRYTSDAGKLCGSENIRMRRPLCKSYSMRYEEVFIRQTHPVIYLIFVVPCIRLYSGEISPTRCNNCVFYSQWLYSIYFG